jgi:2-methylcitrate dehydratase PrpD
VRGGLVPFPRGRGQAHQSWAGRGIAWAERRPRRTLCATGIKEEHEWAFERADIRDLAERIEVVETDELNKLYRLAGEGDPRGKYVSKVIVELRDGHTVETGLVEGEINFPQDTWDEESLEDKFRWLTGYVLDEGCVDTLVETIWGFEDLSDVHELMEILA